MFLFVAMVMNVFPNQISGNAVSIYHHFWISFSLSTLPISKMISLYFPETRGHMKDLDMLQVLQPMTALRIETSKSNPIIIH